ncbi:hypothetical protein [Gallaecimonas xiamenensis]|uniref:Uncharacterized protein n=1 Tax=Gallaecimonas xiamenensis 3-C-1 TaxID=745411 RepID=K2JBM8_9GAMM|nr:hypothetical protein [Gallaecimonas xiamenensis]EKE68039.1 hypothetical protein B3C1_17567 [Gallaecimonas xiamenensis 3-C-1]
MNFFATPDPDRLVYIDPEEGAPRVHHLGIRPQDQGGDTELLWATALNEAQGITQVVGFFNGVDHKGRCATLLCNDGGLYLLDFDNQAQELVHHYRLDYCRAQILADGATLAVLWEDQNAHCHKVDRWQWGDDQQLYRTGRFQVETPEGYSIRFHDPLLAGPGTSLVLHCSRENRNSGRTCQSLLRFALPQDRDGGVVKAKGLAQGPDALGWREAPQRLALDPALGLLALPSVKVPVTEQGDFLYQLDIIDLHQGQRVARLPVRQFSPQQLHANRFRAAERAEVLQRLAAGTLEEEQDWEKGQEYLGEFLAILQSLRFCPGEEALWLCWDGGLVRKVSLDGQWRSPLYVPEQAEDEETQLLSLGPELLLDDWQRFTNLTPDPASHPGSRRQSASAELQDIVPVSLNWQGWEQNWQLDEAQQRMLDRLGSTLIETSDLSSPVSLGFAVKRLAVKAEFIEDLCFGNKLRLTFTDGKEDWDEARFFEAVVQVPGAQADMAEILERFIAYDGSDNCFCTNYRPALADCALQLGLADAKWLPLVGRYLNAIDPDHECFFTNEGLGLLAERHGHEPGWPAFYASVPYPIAGDDGYEDEEYEEDY